MLLIYTLKSIVELICLYFTLQMVFDAGLERKGRGVLCVIAYIVITVVQVRFAYAVNINSLFGFAMTLCATFAYSTILINRLLATTLTFCIGLCSEGIVFLTCKFILAKPIQLITPELQIFPLIILACAIVQFALTLGLCKIVEIYRRKPPSIYTTILLVISFLGILAIEMFVTFAETKYLPTAIITIVLVIVCIALCAGLFRDQLRIQEDRIRLGFLNKQVDDQIEQYKKVQLHNEDICQIEHDLKNYIINAKTLLEQKEYDRLNSLLSKLDSKIRPRLLVNTGNMEIDSVLSAKRT